MKHKRLNRDGWGFQYYPYYQMRIDCECFHGLACLIRFTDGEANYWATPKAGRIQVTGEGMTWLELIPDHEKRVITIKYFPDGTHDEERTNYPKSFCTKYRPSIWYVDVIEGMEYDEDGIAVFIDKYLDVIFTPEGDVKIDDRSELDQAHDAGELSDEQYADALAECDRILKELCSDIAKTNAWCGKVREIVEERIAAGEGIKKSREVLALEKRGYPTRQKAQELVREAEERNPGPWGDHSRTAAHCAEQIAARSGMDAEKAYVLGLLHDIGRRFGKRHLGHVSDGYSYMTSLGYTDAARICLTHSFNQKKLEAYVGNFDTSEEETNLIRTKLQETELDDYDRLIQLCDSISGAEGVMDIIDRMSDVKRRYGDYDQEKWDANLALKDYFEKKMGMDLYEAVDKEHFRPSAK